MNGNGATTVDIEKLAEFSEQAAKLTDHFTGAIRTALGNAVSLSMALGATDAAAQEAIERALMMTAVATFQQRVMKRTGKPASFMDACLAMAAMIDDPNHKPGEASEAMPLDNVLRPPN